VDRSNRQQCVTGNRREEQTEMERARGSGRHDNDMKERAARKREMQREGSREREGGGEKKWSGNGDG